MLATSPTCYVASSGSTIIKESPFLSFSPPSLLNHQRLFFSSIVRRRRFRATTTGGPSGYVNVSELARSDAWWLRRRGQAELRRRRLGPGGGAARSSLRQRRRRAKLRRRRRGGQAAARPDPARRRRPSSPPSAVASPPLPVHGVISSATTSSWLWRFDLPGRRRRWRQPTLLLPRYRLLLQPVGCLAPLPSLL